MRLYLCPGRCARSRPNRDDDACMASSCLLPEPTHVHAANCWKHTGPETAILFFVPISDQIAAVKFCGAVSRVSTTARASENSNPIAPHTRFHASARARPGFPCAPRNAPRRKGGPAEMAMARWPMAALLASVAPIGRHPSDVRGMPPAWNRSAAAELMVGRWH